MNTNTQQTVATEQSQAFTLSTTLQIAAALAIGSLLIFVVGFSHLEIAHNAAHDARHAFAFPCH